MEPPLHRKACSNNPLRIDIPLKQNLLPLDPVILRSWVKSKLSVVPFTYIKYEEGMEEIKEQIQQDFFPQYHNLVMQAFYQEFYTIKVGSGETGDKLWARWRTNHRKLESDRRSSSIYSTVDTEDPIPDSRYSELSSLQDRSATLAILTGASQSIGATKERQIRTSHLISEAEVKLLRNRDSNYWGDLATPILPQTAGKVKVVYIPSKSARNTVNIENQQLRESDMSARPPISHKSNGNFRGSSLPACTSQIDDSSATREIIENIPTLEIFPKTQRIKNAASAQHSPVSIGDLENGPSYSPIVSPGPQKHHDDKSLLSNTPTSASPTKNLHGDSRRSFGGDATPPCTFGRSGKVLPTFTKYGSVERNHNNSKQSLPESPVAGNSEGATKRHEGIGLKATSSPRSRNSHLSPNDRTKPAPRTNNSALGTHLKGYGMPVREVHQGHGTLGIRSPVMSFVASPNTEDPVTEKRSYQTSQPQAAKKSLHLTPTPPYPRGHPLSQLHGFPEINHSSNFKDYNGYSGFDKDARRFRDSNRFSVRKYSSHPPDNHGGRDASSRDDGVTFANNEVSCLSTTPKTPHAKELPWDGKPIPPLHQYQRSKTSQFFSDRAQVPWNSFEIPRIKDINETTNHCRVSQKIRSRFSFVLPYKHLGSRTAAHNTRKRSSLQVNGLRVTKEVLREEEDDTAGNPNRSTFTAQVACFGKDQMKEVHKAHIKADVKKLAFLRVIHDAVHDGINIGKKTPLKVTALGVNTLRTPKQHGKISKLTISEPIHDGNPLKMSSSRSTPKVLLNATPIPGVHRTCLSPLQNTTKLSTKQQKLPVITVLDPYGQRKSQTELTPWELNNTPTTNDEPLSASDLEDATDIQAMAQVRKPVLKSVDQPTITIDPFQQASLYSWIECSVVQACSDFLRQQQKHLNLDLLRKEVKKWKNSQLKLSTGETKPRDQPVEFMFGMEIQCKLLEGNYKTLHFSGPSAMNAITVINSWKHIIPSFFPRTFCFPDYLVLEHLRVIEKVLRLFGPSYWDSAMFEKKRAEAVKRIMEAGQSQKAWSEADKISKLQKDRERAEASLLQAVGIWSTEDSHAVVASEATKDGDGVLVGRVESE